jgi:hypothetical protein
MRLRCERKGKERGAKKIYSKIIEHNKGKLTLSRENYKSFSPMQSPTIFSISSI